MYWFPKLYREPRAVLIGIGINVERLLLQQLGGSSLVDIWLLLRSGTGRSLGEALRRKSR